MSFTTWPTLAIHASQCRVDSARLTSPHTIDTVCECGNILSERQIAAAVGEEK